MNIDKYLQENKIEVDSYGRIIIKNEELLKNINGAISMDINIPDETYETLNVNCIC